MSPRPVVATLLLASLAAPAFAAKASGTSKAAATSVSFPALPSYTGLPGDTQFTAFSDNQCKNQIHPTWEESSVSHGLILMSPSQGWPDAASFSKASFPGSANNNSAGGVVYWNVPAPGTDCRNVLMQDWPADGSYGDTGTPQGYGMTVLDVNEAGCFYSSFPEGKGDFFWSFCCGTDCANYSANNTALSKRDDADAETVEEPVARGGSLAGQAASLSRALLAERTEEKAAASTGSFDTSKCKVVSKNGPRVSSGPQVMVGSAQNCPASTSGSCSFSAANGETQATTLSSSETQTITDGVSGSFTVSQDINWLIASSSVSVTVGFDISKAIAKETGQSITNTTTFTFTNQVSQYPGTNGFVTFIPTYQCYSVTVDCGGGPTQPLSLCTTSKDQGSYQMVVTN